MRVLVGDATGLVKAVTFPIKATKRYGTQAKKHEVRAMCFRDKEESVVVAFQSGEIVDVDTKLTSAQTVSPKGGKGALTVSANANRIVVCDSKKVSVLSRDLLDVAAAGTTTEVNTFQVSQRGIHCGAVCQTNSTVCVGGKFTEMEVWNLEQGKQIFAAKRVKNDFLDLSVPIWNTTCCFDPSNPSIFLAANAFHKVRVYDTRASKRPVVDFELGEERLTSSTYTHKTQQAIIGNTAGEVFRTDLRKKKIVNKYKGPGGSVTSICMHPSRDIFGVCSLDRYFRVYAVMDKTIKHKLYMKQQLLTCLVSDEWSEEDDVLVETKEERRKRERREKGEESEEEEEDEEEERKAKLRRL